MGSGRVSQTPDVISQDAGDKTRGRIGQKTHGIADPVVTVKGRRGTPILIDQNANTGCVLLWGGGGPRYWDVFWKAAKKARKENGAKIIVIDPRKMDSVALLSLGVPPGEIYAENASGPHHADSAENSRGTGHRRWRLGLD